MCIKMLHCYLNKSLTVQFKMTMKASSVHAGRAWAAQRVPFASELGVLEQKCGQGAQLKVLTFKGVRRGNAEEPAPWGPGCRGPAHSFRLRCGREHVAHRADAPRPAAGGLSASPPPLVVQVQRALGPTTRPDLSMEPMPVPGHRCPPPLEKPASGPSTVTRPTSAVSRPPGRAPARPARRAVFCYLGSHRLAPRPRPTD